MALKQDIGLPCNSCSSCTGFKIHGWRKTCDKCKCSVDKHDISDESTLPILDEMKLDKPITAEYKEALSLAHKTNKAWLPVGIKFTEIEEFIQSYKAYPSVASRKKNLRLQIPVQDRCVEKFNHLSTVAEREEAEKFLLNRNNRDIGLGNAVRVGDDTLTCADCQTAIKSNSLSISTEHISGTKQFFHPDCFKCTTCQEPLVDFIFASYNQKPYCIRHYAKNIRPRCGECDELIFSIEYIRAGDEEYHANHFACHICDGSLAKQTHLQHNGLATCSQCYNQQFSNKCVKCTKPITCESKDFSYNSNHWHGDCFQCTLCNELLEGKQFLYLSDTLYCAKCHQDKMLPKCIGCNRPVENGTKLVTYDDKNWHFRCFICRDCKKPIGDESFVNIDKKMVCTKCFDAKYARKCYKCDKLVKEGGVVYKGQAYHYDCFVCHHCNCKISDVKFLVKNNFYYCKGCSEKLFSSKCKKCANIISGDSICKYVQFEDQNWHLGCFSCNKCLGSLVDKGFLMKDSDVFCIQCGGT